MRPSDSAHPIADDVPLARSVASLARVGSRLVEDQVTAARQRGQRILPLHGGPVLPLPDHVRAAILAVVDEGGIRPSRGIPELRSAIADSLHTETGATIDPGSEVLVTNGAMQALSIVFRSLLNPGDRVLIPAPAFFFEGVIRMSGAEPVYIPTDEGAAWRWDLDRIAAAVDERTKLVVFANPGNPTGFMPSRDDLAALGELAEQHGFSIVSDESYERLVFDGRRTQSIAAVHGASPRTILIRSMTKSYALPNWRIGYIVAHRRVINALLNVFEWECLHCGYAAQQAAAAALRGPQDWLAGVVPELERNRDVLYDVIRRHGQLSCIKPAAAPFLFLNVAHLGPDSAEVAARLLAETGVPTVPGEAFNCPGYLRLPFGGELETIHEAGALLTAWVDRQGRAPA